MTKELHEKLYHIRYHCLSSKGKQYLDEIEELLENCLTPVAVIDCKVDEEELKEIVRKTIVTIGNDELPTKKGRWIWKDFDEDTGITNSYWCSECNKPLTGLAMTYCACCGAKMEGSYTQ